MGNRIRTNRGGVRDDEVVDAVSSTPRTVNEAAVNSSDGDFSTPRDRNMRSGTTTPSRIFQHEHDALRVENGQEDEGLAV